MAFLLSTGVAVTYDKIGNPLSDGTWTYTWENGRQLKQMQSVDTTASFVYNESGLRVQKTVNGVVTDYTLHGKNIVHMKTGNDELHFFYDAQNKPAVVVYNGTAYAYVKNLQGDVVALLDNTAAVVVAYKYDAWGRPISKTGTLASTLGTVQPFRYRGYIYDEETGLYYLRSRYYNPNSIRFLNADIYIKSSYNLYRYCFPSPINMQDPDGTAEFFEMFWDETSNASLLGPCMLPVLAGMYQGNTSEVWDPNGVWARAMAEEERWINSPYNTSDSSSGNTVSPEKLKQFATDAANQYITNNPGKGAVYGTKGHTYVETLIKVQNWSNVVIEVSYMNGYLVNYGTSGSVRLDIVLVNSNGVPEYAIDLKFGITPLTQNRIDQINNHLPSPIPIVQVP